jgi:hypothetical protein
MNDFHEQQALLQRLRESIDPAAWAAARQLDQLYHARQMAALAQDVYLAAKGEGQPPPGWTRLSEQPKQLADFAHRLNMTPAQLLHLLRPNESGFRAEIYLPDAGVLGPGYKISVAIKGSSGQVMTSDGKLHDTTSEDFAGNNFPQSIGMETDYYDRGMTLALHLQEEGVSVEYTGHSLGGGVASAASAVSGERATTFNAAGLNPLTTTRFATQHPSVRVYQDLDQRITAYQVQGELLNDGVQNNARRMDVFERNELAGVLGETADLLQRVPGMRDVLQDRLAEGMPPQARDTLHGFVDRLADGNVSHMLAELPLAAGRVEVLAPMTRDAQGRLVARAPTMGLPEATVLAGPVLEAAAAASLGARLGERGGEVMAGAGRLESQALHLYGDGAQALGERVGRDLQGDTLRQGALLQTGEHYAGAALAGAREAHAELRAQLDRAVGEAQHAGAALDANLLRGAGRLLPPEAQAWAEARADRLEQAGEDARREGLARATADRRMGQAESAAIRGITEAAETATAQAAVRYGDLQHEVLADVGKGAADRLDALGRRVEGASRHAPATYAAAGATAALGIASILELQPGNYPRLANAARVIAQGRQVGAEAFERHLMAPTVTPSMDARIAAEEERARRLLQRTAPDHAADAAPAAGDRIGTTPPIPAHLRDFRHPDHPANLRYRAVLGKVHALEDAGGIPHGPHSERVAATLVERMHEQRFGGLGRLEWHGEGDAMQVVAYESRPSYFMPEREIRLDLERATAGTVEQASLDWSRRALPHLHQPACPSPGLGATLPDVVPAHDPRHPEHADHGHYQKLRGEVAQAYARVGLVRNEAELEQATAAVMLGAARHRLDWSRPHRLFVPPDPQTGVVAPANGLVLQQPHPATILLTSMGAQDLKQAPEASYRQLAQGGQAPSPLPPEHDRQGPAPALA